LIHFYKRIDRMEHEKGRKWSQILPAFIATLGAFGCGTVLAWPAVALPKLDESVCGTDCDITISKDEASFLSAVSNLGGMCVGPFAAILMLKFGKKWTMIILSVPFVVGWVLLVFANGLGMLYTGRILTGFSGGAFGLVAPAYTTEISETSIRGALGSLQQLMCTLGVLLVDVLRKYVSWQVSTWICMVFPLLLGLGMIFMPQSPFYLISKNREEDAKKSLSRLRGPTFNAEAEIKLIRTAVEESQAIGSVSIKTLFLNREYLTPLCISLVVMFLQQFSGINAVIAYTPKIFEAAHSTMDEDLSTILVALMQVVGTAIAVLVVDRFGRKFLLIFSDTMMALSLAALGTYFYLQHEGNDVESLSWLPVVSLMVFIFSFAIGFGPLPWVLNSELFAKEAKGPAAAICASFNWMCSFLVVKFEPDMEDALGNYGAYFLFAAICALGALFILVVVPETKGRSEEQMREYFKKSSK